MTICRLLVKHFSQANQALVKDQFKGKVKIAFSHAGCMDATKCSKVRKWISDDLTKHFKSQFEMMKKLEQVNKLSNIDISQIQYLKSLHRR